MKIKATKPFQRSVTLEQLLAYDPNDPQTFTDTPLVNAVMDAMFEVHPVTRENVGEYLQVEPTKLSAALEVLTGYNFFKLRAEWMQHRLRLIEKKNPLLSSDEKARLIGLQDGSAIWRMKHRNVRKAIYAQKKKEGYMDSYR